MQASVVTKSSTRPYGADHGATLVAADGSSQLYRTGGTLALLVAADGARTECDLDGMTPTTTHLPGQVDIWQNGAMGVACRFKWQDSCGLVWEEPSPLEDGSPGGRRRVCTYAITGLASPRRPLASLARRIHVRLQL